MIVLKSELPTKERNRVWTLTEALDASNRLHFFVFKVKGSSKLKVRYVICDFQQSTDAVYASIARLNIIKTFLSVSVHI